MFERFSLDVSLRLGRRRLPCRGIRFLLGIVQLLYEFRDGCLAIGVDGSGMGVYVWFHRAAPLSRGWGLDLL